MRMINGVAVSGIIVDSILFLIIVGNAILGYKRGLSKLVFSLFFNIITIILVLILYKPTTNYIMYNTQIGENLQNIFEEKIGYLFEKDKIESAAQLQNGDNVNGILKVFIGKEMADFTHQTLQGIIKSIANEITYRVIGVLVYFILFAIIRLLLSILKNYVELITSLPGLRLINGSGGMIYGVIRGFFIIYIALVILSLMMPIIGETIIFTAIEEAPIGAKMFHNNVILNIIFYFL